jgi:phage terminase large subunit
MLEYVPRPQFLPFHNRRHRWAVLNTHRRAGKTVALTNDLVVGALQNQLRKPQLAYIGPTFTQAKRIAWQYLKDYAEPYLSKPPSESELKITLHGERTLYCLGADNPDSLRGMYLDGAVMDEYALFRPSVFSTIIRPALSDRNGWGVFASTPRGKNLFYSEYKKAIKNPKEYFQLTLRASDSGLIHPLELEALRKDMDPEEYAQEYECSFDAALKGAIYAEEINAVFADQRVRPSLYDPNLPTHVVFDLGFTDATVAIYWQEAPDGTIRIVNVEVTNGKDIFHHIDRIIQFKGQADLGSVWLPHDAKAKNLQTGKSIVEQFLDNDIRPQIVPNHKVRDRIAATRSIFPRVHFDETVTEDLLEALKGYRREWDDNLLMFKDIPMHDWCSDYADAFGYMGVVAAPKFGNLGTADMSPDAIRTQNERASKRPLPGQYTMANLFQDYEDRQKGLRRRIS